MPRKPSLACAVCLQAGIAQEEENEDEDDEDEDDEDFDEQERLLDGEVFSYLEDEEEDDDVEEEDDEDDDDDEEVLTWNSCDENALLHPLSRRGSGCQTEGSHASSALHEIALAGAHLHAQLTICHLGVLSRQHFLRSRKLSTQACRGVDCYRCFDQAAAGMPNGMGLMDEDEDDDDDDDEDDEEGGQQEQVPLHLSSSPRQQQQGLGGSW